MYNILTLSLSFSVMCGASRQMRQTAAFASKQATIRLSSNLNQSKEDNGAPKPKGFTFPQDPNKHNLSLKGDTPPTNNDERRRLLKEICDI